MSAASVSDSTLQRFAVYEVTIARYLLFGAYTFLLLEHLAYIPEEIKVWKSSRNAAKFFFIIYRYSAVAGLTVIMHMSTGITNGLDELICKRIVAAAIAMFTVSIVLADALVVLRVSVLWRRQRSVLVLLALALFLSGAVAVTLAARSGTQIVARTVFIPPLKMCNPFGKPRLLFSVWIPGILFDILVLTLTIYNALSRPRDYRTKLTRAMHRDGIMYFLFLSGLRLTNLLVSLVTNHYIISLFFTWSVSAATLSRFIFHLRSVEEATSSTEAHLSSGPRQERGGGEALEQMPFLACLPGEVLPMRRWSGGHGAETSQSWGSSSAGKGDFFTKR